ncbi:metal ABC transporter ATP-binding protein [Serinibacter salmoneus]|uniref:Zinc transport system ATP-binding protein n=1 Tax=Serinibacter salmoneus TaxID=556530 RepID=A0A2A9D2C7_9MICO|nr:ABC transporter ATP-binding protein [Serinibacter salmoneus]PFG20010.1 zinc transport system ATP-binding protein [Serinibacter salmoneus]
MILPLHVEHLDVTLGGSRILRDVSVRVASGECVALLGANGSGKSTLVRAALGVVPASAGQVHLFGTPVARRRSVPWERVGYVPQRSTAVAGVPATVREVVTSGLLSARRIAPPRDARARVLAALERVGMAAHLRRPIAQLSGGQQQRVLIARALVREPEFLVLDEPLAGVDTDSQATFASTLRRLRRDGLTVLVVLHESGPLAPLLTRAVVLRHGAVVHDGPPPHPAPGHDEADHDHQHDHAEPDLAPAALALNPENLA